MITPFLTPDVCDELTRLSDQASRPGATIGGIVYARMAEDFGRYSAALDGDTSDETQDRHAAAMSYITTHGREITISAESLLRLAEILAPGTAIDASALAVALERLPPSDTHPHPFETSIALLTHLSLAPIPGAAALARAACNIPLRTKGLSPMLFVGVEHHFPGLEAFSDRGDASRLVNAYRIAYGASCKQFGQCFYGY